MPFDRLDVAIDHRSTADDAELLAQEPELQPLIGEDLVLRLEVPELAPERPDGLLAREIDELLVRLVGLALVERVREAPALDLAEEVLRQGGILVEQVLEARRAVDPARLARGE